MLHMLPILINVVHCGHNPLNNLLLSSWDIQAVYLPDGPRADRHKWSYFTPMINGRKFMDRWGYFTSRNGVISPYLKPTCPMHEIFTHLYKPPNVGKCSIHSAHMGNSIGGPYLVLLLLEETLHHL